jgi:hypothetical protein
MTKAQLLGAGAALAAALLGLFQLTRTVTNPTTTRACIAFDGAKPANLKTSRFYGLRISPAAQSLLNFSPTTDWEYIAAEIQSVDDATPPPALMARLDMNADIVDEYEDRVTPLFPDCQVFAVRSDDPSFPAKCACSTGPTCLWTPPLPGGGFGTSVAAPRNLTLPPGTWSGVGCKRKVCIELGGSTSMPAACIP